MKRVSSEEVMYILGLGIQVKKNQQGNKSRPKKTVVEKVIDNCEVPTIFHNQI